MMRSSLIAPANPVLHSFRSVERLREVQPLIGAGEGGQQELELPNSQPSECQELPTVTLKLGVGHHEASLLLFRIMSLEDQT